MTALQTALATARDLSSKAKEVRARLANEQFTLSGYAEWRKANDDWDDFARTFTDNAVTALAAAEKYLTEIASFGEGPVVTGSFDEPGAAQGARDALTAMERAFDP